MEPIPSPEKPLRTVLLAGGLGTRIAQLLDDLPKPMAPVAGRPFIEWVIRHFAACGLTDFILSTGHRSEAIETHFASNPVPGTCVVCSREPGPLGTGGGFLHATADQPEPAGGWLVANGDSLVLADPTALPRAAAAAGWEAALLGLRLPDAARFGSLITAPNGTLRAFAEKRPGAGMINAGVYWFAPGLRTRIPSRQPLSFEHHVFPGLLHEGIHVGVVPVEAPFIDIGTPESLVAAEAFIRAHLSRRGS